MVELYTPLKDDYYFGFTLQIASPVDPQCTVYDLSATFINNSAAIAGDHLYGGVLVLCQNAWVTGTRDYLEEAIKLY